jgi:predicted NBD/HSP70 family sugar kinase
MPASERQRASDQTLRRQFTAWPGNAMNGVVVGVDLGGTRLRSGAAPADESVPVAGNVVQLADRPAPARLGELGAALDAVLVAAAPLGRVAGMAIAVPGLVAGSICRWVPNLPYLDGVDLAAITAHVVAVGNDAHFALLAEATEGAAFERADALLLAIGTGIGSAVLSDGRIVRGSHHGAASFGWACAEVADPGDDRDGWLERHAAGPVLDAAGAKMTPPVDGRGLVDSAIAGDSAARATLDRVGTILGTALAGAVALLDPGIVIISGGLADAVDALAPALHRALTRQLPAHLRDIEVVRGALGPSAGLIGALIAARSGPEWWQVTG